MKKFILPSLLLVLGLFIFTACGGDRPQSVDESNPLIGEWEWNLYDGLFMEFNADGTGSRNWWEGDPQTFDWWTVGDDLLRVNITGGYEEAEAALATEGYLLNLDEHWTFSFIGNDVLIIESRQVAGEIWTYHRVN